MSAVELLEERKVKIVVVGDFGVGKSSLVNRLCYGDRCNFHDEPISPTIGCSVHTALHDMKSAHDRIHFSTVNHHDSSKGSSRSAENLWFLDFYDIAGKNRYRKARQFLYRDSDGVILVFDLANVNSRNNLLDKWLPEMEANLSGPAVISAASSNGKRSRMNIFQPMEHSLSSKEMFTAGSNKPYMQGSRSFPDLISSLIPGLNVESESSSLSIPALLVGTHYDRVASARKIGTDTRRTDDVAFASGLGVDLVSVSCLDPSHFRPESEVTLKMNTFYHDVIRFKVQQNQLTNWRIQQLLK